MTIMSIRGGKLHHAVEALPDGASHSLTGSVGLIVGGSVGETIECRYVRKGNILVQAALDAHESIALIPLNVQSQILNMALFGVEASCR